MKPVSVPDSLANPTGHKYFWFAGEHCRRFENDSITMPVRTEKERGSPANDIVTPRTECLFCQNIVQLGPSGCDSHKLGTAEQISRQLVHIADVPSSLLSKISALRGRHQPKLKAGCRKLDRLPKCTLDAFKSVTRDREIASRA